MRIGEKVKYALNPLPDISSADVLKRADLPRRQATKDHPFAFHWKVGSQEDTQFFHIEPGDEPIALRGKEEWMVFENQWAEWGGVAVEDPEDEVEVYHARVDALRRAVESWNAVGVERADAYQITQGLTDEQMQRQRGQIWRWYYNQVLADVCGEELDKLLEAGEPKPKAPARRSAPKKD